jgi:hypothetical protein
VDVLQAVASKGGEQDVGRPAFVGAPEELSENQLKDLYA